jgi:hypothetical protein
LGDSKSSSPYVTDSPSAFYKAQVELGCIYWLFEGLCDDVRFARSALFLPR